MSDNDKSAQQPTAMTEVSEAKPDIDERQHSAIPTESEKIVNELRDNLQSSKTRALRSAATIFSALVLLGGIFFAGFGNYDSLLSSTFFQESRYFDYPRHSAFRDFVIGVLFLLAVVAAIIWFFFYFIATLNLRTELEIARKRQQVLSQLKPSKKPRQIQPVPVESGKPFPEEKPLAGDTREVAPPPSYFDSLVEINVTNLAEYYVLVKAHTNNSFRASMIAGVIGFGFILSGLGIGLFGGANTQTLAYVSAASGVAVEFISGIFFYLYNKTVRQLKEYHDSLISVQNILLSFKIVEDTKDDTQKAHMVNQMLAYIIGKQSISAGAEKPPESPK
jgi:small-conductance mechanosensitive channel